MSDWDIDVEQIVPILQSVVDLNTKLSEVLDPGYLDGLDDGLTWGGEFTACVVNSLAHAINSQSDNINVIVNGVAAGLSGVSYAAQAYVNADLDMAATMQQNAAASASSGDFSWTTENG